MNLQLTLWHIQRLAYLYQIHRSEKIIDKYKDTSNRRIINQAVFELLQLKTTYNQKYGFDRTQD